MFELEGHVPPNGPDEERRTIGALRRAIDVIRCTNKMPDLSSAWVQVLLAVAETPAQPLSWIARESSLTSSGAHRVLLALSDKGRFGQPRLGLIADIADPRRSNRRLYFLTEKGRG